ncbi:MAG: O-succinylbenzoic acid--CoA ligase [Promethearchaeota archaeon]|nr:MAG: O-succinylbenzoic acid--CoA ligase [Candidatus Lokiarchaeota archaeon]
MDIPKLEYIWEYIEYWSEKDPNFSLIKFGKKEFTAEELNKQIDSLAMTLLDMNLKKGDTIATVLPTIPEFFITFMAASKIGAITIPMDKEYKKTDFKTLIPHSNPKVIITIDKWEKNRIADNLQELSSEFGERKYIIVGKHELGIPFESVISKKYDLEDKLKEAKENQSADDSTLVIWTGGTTGAPKAVEITHRNFITMCLIEHETIFGTLEKLGYDTNRQKMHHVVNLPVSHVGGTIEILGTGLIGGLSMIFQASWSPWDSLKAMQKYSLPFMGGVPTMLKILLSLPDLDNYKPKENLKLVVMSGEKVSYELLKGIKEKICENIIIGYGSTEAGSEVTFTEVLNTDEQFRKVAEGYVGKALPGMDIKIIDEDNNEVATGKIGEIITNGPLTAKSYFKMPEKTKKGFTEDGYCKTGDLGYKDEEGGIYITGRIKQIIRVGAYTVYPGEIEELVLSHPKVAIAAALGAPDEIKGEVVWLVIGPELGMKFDEGDKEEIMRLCKENLAKFKVPEKLIVYQLDPNNLPITRIGKVDKVRLKKELIPEKE